MPGSAFSIPPSVSSENTTPKPNVSSGALRSQTVISASGESWRASAAKYSPPGPPPATAIRMPASTEFPIACVPSPRRGYVGSKTVVNRTLYDWLERVLNGDTHNMVPGISARCSLRWGTWRLVRRKAQRALVLARPAAAGKRATHLGAGPVLPRGGAPALSGVAQRVVAAGTASHR